MTASKRACFIAKICLRRNLPPHLLISLALLLAGFLFMAPAHWELTPTASFLETMVALAGPVLLTPLFLPEQDPAVADVLRSRRTPYSMILWVRAACSLLFVVLLTGAAVLVLGLRQCELSPVLWAGTLSSAVLLGGLGAFTFSLTGNLATAYMAPALYYALGLGMGKRLGLLNLFALSMGGGDPKLVQLLLGLVLLCAAIPVWCKNRRLS